MNSYHNRERKDYYLASLLYDAIEFRHFSSIKSLIVEKGANPNWILPSKGISPFHLAIGCDSANFAEQVTSLILQNGGNPNVRSDDGLTPVHIAAAWGRYQLLQLLLQCGGDPQVQDANHRTPVFYAREGAYADCLQLLRSFYPPPVFSQEKDDAYSLVLDKILVDDGQLVTEFNVVNEYPKRSINQSQGNSPSNLHSLPKADVTEYIINWFKKQPALDTEISQVHDEVSNNKESIFHIESSPDESDSINQSDKRTNPRYITFRKVYHKTKKISKSPSLSPNGSKRAHSLAGNTVYLDATSMLNSTQSGTAADFTNCKDFSRESGIVTLPVTFKDSTVNRSNKSCSLGLLERIDKASKQINLDKVDKSSDYVTCSHSSIDAFERNILELTEEFSANFNLDEDVERREPDLCNVAGGREIDDNKRKSAVSSVASTDLSFVSVSEVYKYVDRDEDIVLYERRLIKATSECAESLKSLSLSSAPSNLDYDTDTIRKELTLLGYNPGPITVTTKRVYVKKLHQLKKYPVHREALLQNGSSSTKKAYSLELEKTLRNTDWCQNIAVYKTLEQVLVKEFQHPDTTKKWREGVCKASFTYLLLDPRKTNNLPCRAENMQPNEVWESFLSAIFYVGKGKRARPYQHLYEAVDLWKKDITISNSKKIRTIFDIWKTGNGVICLHVFLNVIPAEAYTREAAMISALKLENLTNMKGGEFYGVPSTWTQRQKKMLGVYLLYKAMMIFLNEGERQLCPADVD